MFFVQDTSQNNFPATVPDSPVVSIDTSQAALPDSHQQIISDTAFRRPLRKKVPLQTSDSMHGSQLHVAVQQDSGIHSSIPVLFKDKKIDSANSRVEPGTINMYQGHVLIPSHRAPEPRPDLSPDWFFPILLISISVITWLRIYFTRYFMQIFQAFLKNNIANQIVRDENIVIQRVSITLSVSFNLIVALFLYQVSLYKGWNIGGMGMGFNLFLFFAILVSSIYTLKFLILKICGWLFDQEREMATYIFNTFLINHMLGIVLIPTVALMAYNEVIPSGLILMVSIGLISCAFIYRLIRGILIGIGVPGFSSLYLFLYLCTLEIAPLLVLARIISS